MNIISTTSIKHILPVITFAIFLFAGCSDNPASNDDDHEHSDPAGLELVYDGDVIIEYFDQTVTEHEHMHMHAGEEYHFEVHFLAEDGDHIHDEDLGEEYSLGWIIENEDVLEIEQHDEDGKWSFHLVGVAEGTSKVQFLLNHGDHADFETPGINMENAIEFHVEAEGHEE